MPSPVKYYPNFKLGLHAAYTLSEKGISDVVVLEAQERIGGRIKSQQIKGPQINDGWIELGAQWIHGRGKNPLWKFCLEKKVSCICYEQETRFRV